MWYNIDWNRFAAEYMPTYLRKPVWLALVRSIFRPVIYLYNIWYEWRRSNVYLLTHTGQVFSLEKSLNDHFDIAQRRIYITDGYRYERFYIYTYAEHRPIYLGTKYLHSSSDFADTGVDFIVWIPASLSGNRLAIQFHVNRYKEASKRFKIAII